MENINQQYEQKEARVIDLKYAKESLEGKKENDSLSRYFQVLSFSELLAETSALIDELNNKGSTKEIINKSKIILKELGLRFKNSKGLTENFIKMRDELEKKLSLF